ncbi:NmrA/HSCARG family protein [Leptolyngbya sp. FACHB-711]|uniref:NmrA/HSCARG family protein n=1 Tax=unclassified Leptolyngbya TaxID=2650499 RepID=UPI001683D02F|nr:NmrA/HSCARG family protein [Leptolyngbya sp. FACHB-711]MBD1848500.1 NmrA/HSCARG family protein [Cyanobacteria bacterium FACHB-502]MBD2026688.1 NmrA/HSCARG family protein [Leptolyngbya sp. FACHB-711]
MTQSTHTERLILVTGATGNQGSAIARHLLQRGNFKVRALVRDSNKPAAQALQQAGAELVVGDLNDRDSLDRALQGAYGVFSLQIFQDGLDTEIRQGKAVADAAKAANIQHFVYSSVGSAERNTGVPHFDSKFQVEEYIRASELPYTILRPVFFFYNYNMLRSMVETGTLFQPLSPETKLQQLSEEDYGEMVADVFDHPADFMKGEIELASVDMTMPEVAAAFSRVLGKPVQYQQIPFETFEQQIGEELTIMYRWFENVGYGADLTQLKRNFSAQTDFESYLRDHDWQNQPEA